MADLHPDSEVIDRLGGTFALATLCDVKPPSVSEWRRTGIPKARRQFLQVIKPEAFAADERGDVAPPFRSACPTDASAVQPCGRALDGIAAVQREPETDGVRAAAK